MRYAIQAIKPDAVIHLGDYYDDGEAMAEENPHLVFHQVNGNCDRYRSYEIRPEALCYPVGGVLFYMTHGHNHHVKTSLYSLLRDGERLKPLSEVYPDGNLPKGAMADGFGIRLSDTDFYKYHPEAQVIPDTAILCLHRPTLAGRGQDADLYAHDVAYFRALADFEVQE